MEYLTKIYMMMWENRKVILTFPTIKGEIQQWKNPMEIPRIQQKSAQN